VVVYIVKRNENTYPKGKVLMKTYTVVPQTKRDNTPI